MDIVAKKMNNSGLIRIFLYALIAVVGACAFGSLCPKSGASHIGGLGRTLRSSTLAITTSDVLCALILVMLLLCAMVILLIIVAGFGQRSSLEDGVTIELFRRCNRSDPGLVKVAKSLQGDWITSEVKGDPTRFLKELGESRTQIYILKNWAKWGVGVFQNNTRVEASSRMMSEVGAQVFGVSFTETLEWRLCGGLQEQSAKGKSFKASLSVESPHELPTDGEMAKARSGLRPVGDVLVARGFWTDDGSVIPTTYSYISENDELVVETAKKFGDTLHWEIRVFERST